MTHWKWQSRRRCSLAELVTTAGVGGRWPAISCVPQTVRSPSLPLAEMEQPALAATPDHHQDALHTKA